MTGGFVLATRDGGAHWTTQLAKAASPLTSVAFPDARHGWAVGGGGLILATADGGATWTTQRSGQTFRLRKVSFASASDGWAIIGNAHLLATRDGGRTWRVINPLPGYHLLADTASLPIVRQ
jgi:photosystem II stability/assembly factor-like uncharacterized protein